MATLISMMLVGSPRLKWSLFSLICLDPGNPEIPAIWHGAGANPGGLSQKPSTENGQFRVAGLILAWVLNVIGVFDNRIPLLLLQPILSRRAWTNIRWAAGVASTHRSILTRNDITLLFNTNMS